MAKTVKGPSEAPDGLHPSTYKKANHLRQTSKYRGTPHQPKTTTKETRP